MNNLASGFGIIDSVMVIEQSRNTSIIPSDYSNYIIFDITIQEVYYILRRLHSAEQRHILEMRARAIINSCTVYQYSNVWNKLFMFYEAIQRFSENEKSKPTLEKMMIGSLGLYKNTTVWGMKGGFLDRYSQSPNNN